MVAVYIQRSASALLPCEMCQMRTVNVALTLNGEQWAIKTPLKHKGEGVYVRVGPSSLVRCGVLECIYIHDSGYKGSGAAGL